jgi:ABC-type glycerol-3-phosphate transport system substrate-binding protein
MKMPTKCMLFAVVGAACATTLLVGATASSEPVKAKNWTPPARKIYAQTLSDEIMAQHPELLSVTFHGVPPGMSKVYTMFAGSYPDRIGNPDDPDDVMIIETGITILDPRWHRVNDARKKFVVMLPLRDTAGENVGLLVLAYKNETDSGKTDKDFFVAASAVRDALEVKIPSYAALFNSVK